MSVMVYVVAVAFVECNKLRGKVIGGEVVWGSGVRVVYRVLVEGGEKGGMKAQKARFREGEKGRVI